jgi:copper chaperone CopZ
LLWQPDPGEQPCGVDTPPLEGDMSRVLILMGVVAATVLATAGASTAAETVELKKVHMCCDGCAEEVATVLSRVEGVTGVSTDKTTTSATFTAADAKVAQKALDALAAAGFHGDPEKGKGYAFQDDSGVKAGTVKALTVTGFHNSCGGCVKSLKEAVKDVNGAAGVTVRAKVGTAEVTGEFEAVELVKALNGAGFHVKIGDRK